jgi:purine nucleosidase
MLPVIALLLLLLMPGYGATPVLLDTDIGDDIDDALALALALQSPELDVKAIITVLQDAPRRADLTWRILELYGRTDIPIGQGAEKPLVAAASTNVVVQTKALRAQDRMPDAKRRNGHELLVETILKSPAKVTILAYGPLTNIGLALRAEPRLRDKIEKIVLMNGVFYRAGVEYNTKRDPEASEIVYREGIPVETVGLDVTLKCRLTPAHLDSMEKSPHEGVRFLRQLITAWQEGKPTQMPILHDPLSVLIAFQPTLVEFETGEVRVETRGDPNLTYGLTAFKKNAQGHVKVAKEVQAGQVVDLFMTRITAAPRKR